MDNRIRELDGIRGIAILLVMLFHILKRSSYLTANPALTAFDEFFRFGWVGVDLFFVLSGYLITSILIKTRSEPDYFKNFYARRILRIFPLYYVTLGILFPILHLLDNDQGLKMQAHWPVFALYLQNWLYIFSGELSYIIGITWSLAIEEQFYLLWPFIVRKLETPKLARFTLGFLAFILLLRLTLPFFASDLIDLHNLYYFGSFIRFDGLLMGALLAMALGYETWRARMQRWVWPTFWSSLAILLVIFFSGPPDPGPANFPLMTVGYTLLAIFFAACVALALTQPETDLLRQLFRAPILLFFGKYSYALYLFHMLVTVVLLEIFWDMKRQNALMWASYTALTFGLTILLALISWNLLEKRILALKRYFE